MCSQRDRLQQRIIDLEAECATLQNARQMAVEETEQLRGDNVKLYEKIRYLESYNASLPSRRRQRDIEAAADVESKYRPLYEASVSPFAQFESQERARRVNRLSGGAKCDRSLSDFALAHAASTVERVVMWTSTFFLRSKISRMFLFVYMTMVHVLFLVLLNRYSTCFPLSRANTLEKPPHIP